MSVENAQFIPKQSADIEPDKNVRTNRPAEYNNLLTSDNNLPKNTPEDNSLKGFPDSKDVIIVGEPLLEQENPTLKKALEFKIGVESEYLPGAKKIESLGLNEQRIFFKEVNKEFRKNQPEYREAINEADTHLAGKEKTFMEKMKPGQPGGLEEKELKALDDLDTKKYALEDKLNEVPGSMRLKGAEIAENYMAETDPRTREAYVARLKAMGLGHIVKPLTEMGESMDKNVPILIEASTVRDEYRAALTNSLNTRNHYEEGLKRVASIEPRKGDREELEKIEIDKIGLQRKLDDTTPIISNPFLSINPLMPGEEQDA